MKKAIFAVLLLLATTGRAGAQVVVGDSCFAPADEFLNRVCPDNVNHNVWNNPDSCMIDSCAVSTVDPCGLWFGYVYSKNGYRFNFDSDVFKLPIYPIDTIIAMRWTDLDTSFHFLRNMFDSLEMQWGTFGLLKHYPDATNSDPAAGVYYMVFDSYADAPAVSNFIKNYSSDTLDFTYLGGPFLALSVPNSSTQTNKIFPNPVHSDLNISMPGSLISNVGVIDVCGRLVRSYDLQNPSDTFTLDLTGLLSGVYAIKCGTQIYRIVFDP
jgi:Secretion system C-terminal sorting domain